MFRYLSRFRLITCLLIVSTLALSASSGETSAQSADTLESDALDLLQATRKAVYIIENSTLTKDEAALCFPLIARFAYTEIILKRSLVGGDGASRRAMIQKKFQENIRTTALCIAEKSGRAAARKFRTHLRHEMRRTLQASL